MWPHFRAAFVLFHVVAMFVLAFPAPVGGMNRADWKQPTVQEDFAAWARVFHMSTAAFEDVIYELAVLFMNGRNALADPLGPYVHWTGCAQPWRMFVGPVRKTARLQVQVRARGAAPDAWETLYDEADPKHRWHEPMFGVERVRTQVARWSWPAYQGMFDEGCRYLSRLAFFERPEAQQLRCRFWYARTPTPEEARQHLVPPGSWGEPLVFDRSAP